MVDKEPTFETDRFTSAVLDEFSSLISMYDQDPENREKIIRDYFEDKDRISFGKTGLDDYVNLIQGHFESHAEKYLEDEKSFLFKFSSIDLNSFVKDPINKSKNLFPEELISPTTVFLLNSDKTDGQVIGDNKFGVNLNNIFRRYYDETQRKVDFDIALKDIQGLISHETVHCLCEQLNWRKNDYEKDLIEIAFEEGLATTVQDIFPTHHNRYIEEFDFWKQIIQQALTEDRPWEYYKILKSIKNNENLNEFNPMAVSLIEERFSQGGEISKKEFDFLITKSVIKLNGPIYHVGSKLWSDIFEEEGLENVKKRILIGPSSFQEFFE